MKLYRISFKDRASDTEFCSVAANDFMHACQVFLEACPNAELLSCKEECCYAAIFYTSGSYQTFSE
jgi:hypothetical protein